MVKPPAALAFASSLALSFAAVFYLLVVPQLSQLGELEAKWQSQQAKPIVINRANKEAGVDLTQTTATANLLIPKTDNQYDLSVQIDGLSKAMGIPLTSLVITGAEATTATKKTSVAPLNSGPLKPLTVSLGVACTYQQLQQFVNGLTSLDRFLQINQITVSAASGKNEVSAGNISAQISLFAYYLPAAS